MGRKGSIHGLVETNHDDRENSNAYEELEECEAGIVMDG
jgi:hypothetical protein